MLANGTWDRLSAALVMADRERVGRAPQPTGCVLDSQTAKAGGTGVAGPRGYDPAKKINGRKRHILVDSRGTCWPCASPMGLCRTAMVVLIWFGKPVRSSPGLSA